MSRAVPAPTVEQSITIILGLNPASSPVTTARTSSSADTHITTASQLPASSSRLVKAWQWSSCAKATALSEVRFQTPVRRPERCRLRAICTPMAPSPTNPVCICDPDVDSKEREILRLCAGSGKARLQDSGRAVANPVEFALCVDAFRVDFFGSQVLTLA